MAKFPNVKVKLTGKDGNAFFIMGTVGNALKRAGVPKEDIDKFYAECQSGDYNNLLRVCMETVEVS